MNLNVNLENMKEIYGDDIINIILSNIDIIEINIQTLKKLKFDDVEGIFERCPMMFMYFPKAFNEKIEKIIKEIGENYIDIIQNDISILEKTYE